MIERRLVAELDSAPAVVLDPPQPDSEEALDMAVRAAASLCVHLGQRGGCAMLLPGERRPIEIGPDLAAWAGVHVRLALVEPRARPRPASTLGPRGGAVIWVTGARRCRRAACARAHAGRGAHLVSPAVVPGCPCAVRGGGLHRLPGRASAQGDRGVSAIGARSAAVRPRAAREPLDASALRVARGAPGDVRGAGPVRRRSLVGLVELAAGRPHRPGGRRLDLHGRATARARGARPSAPASTAR